MGEQELDHLRIPLGDGGVKRAPSVLVLAETGLGLGLQQISHSLDGAVLGGVLDGQVQGCCTCNRGLVSANTNYSRSYLQSSASRHCSS